MTQEFRGFAIITIAAGESRISDIVRGGIIRVLKLQGDFSRVQNKRKRLRSSAERAHYIRSRR